MPTLLRPLVPDATGRTAPAPPETRLRIEFDVACDDPCEVVEDFRQTAPEEATVGPIVPFVQFEEAMGLALEEAAMAGAAGDVPVGAVALCGERVIGRGRNEREHRGDPTAHAELLALREASEALGTWRLDAVTLVVTLEPCAMCAGALVAGRVSRLVFAAADPKAGACGSLYNLCADPRLNHEVAVTAGVLAAPAGDLLRDFFSRRRLVDLRGRARR